MSLTGRWICCRASSFNFHSVRTYSARSKKSREIQGGKEPGSQAVFESELKKMKHGVTVDTDLDGNAIGNGREVLLKIAEEYTKRGTAIKYAKQANFLGRQRENRTLSWDNIDRIRYLRQEHPEEWGITELARSFDVPEKTIKKVLKSKFTADSAKRHEQDHLARRNTGALGDQQSPTKKSLIESTTEQTLSVTREHEEPQADARGRSYGHANAVERNYTPKVDSPERVRREEAATVTEAWDMDGTALDAELEELEEFSSILPSDIVEMFEEGGAPPKVIQKGREFLDEDGEFLYKV